MSIFKLTIIIAFLLSSFITHAQNKKDSLLPARKFIDFIGSFSSMKFKSLEASNYSKQGIVIYNTTITSNKLFVSKSYALKLSNKMFENRIRPLVSFVYVKGKLLSIFGDINLFEENGKCDTVLDKQLQSHSNVFEKFHSCIYTYYSLEKTELDLLRDAVGDSLLHSTLEEYESCFDRIGVLKSSPRSIKSTRNVDAFGDPILSIVKELARKYNFQALRKLMHTKNQIFNWFVAEALFFYFESGYTEAIGSWENIQKYNGQGEYKPFRDYYRLRELYSFRGQWNE